MMDDDDEPYFTNDPFELQNRARRAYLLHYQGLLTDEEFGHVIREAIRHTTPFRTEELKR
jgi:hypothetical protein